MDDFALLILDCLVKIRNRNETPISQDLAESFFLHKRGIHSLKRRSDIQQTAAGGSGTLQKSTESFKIDAASVSDRIPLLIIN